MLRSPRSRFVRPLLALLLAASPAPAQTPGSPEEGPLGAARDYLQGIYEADPSRIERSVHPDLAKIGLHLSEGTFSPIGMTYDELLETARTFNARGWIPPHAPGHVELVERTDRMAVVRVTAVWGIDYLNLARFDEGWKIVQVLWQSPPEAAPGWTPPEPPETAGPLAGGTLPVRNAYRAWFTPSGRALYWFEKVAEDAEEYRIFVSYRMGGRWTPAKRVDLGGDHSDLYPTISPDGERLVFASYRPVPGAPEATSSNLWSAEREGAGWGEPRAIPGGVAEGYVSKPAFAADGTLRFQVTTPDWRTTRWYAVRHAGGMWGEVEERTGLEPWTEWAGSERHVWDRILAPDGSFAILEVGPVGEDGRPILSIDLYVSERRGDGWTDPRPLAAGVNTSGTDNFPFFSPDGRTLGFVRDFATLHAVSLASAMAESGGGVAAEEQSRSNRVRDERR